MARLEFAKSYTKEWPILDRKEHTQSNTYMPLICSVMDGFEVDFPPEYPALFSKVAREYNIETLPFKNFAKFQDYLKAHVKKMGLDRSTFFDMCDDKDNYHIEAGIQEVIMKDLDGFFGLFISKLIQFASEKHVAFKKADTMLTCRLKDTLHPDYASGEASRYAEFDAAEAARKAAAHERSKAEYDAHKAAARAKPTDKWYAIDTNDIEEDYPDYVNSQINAAVDRNEPPFAITIRGVNYLIDVYNMTERTNDSSVPLRQRFILKKNPRWYYIEGKKRIPFSEEDNRKIMQGSNGVELVNHYVYPEEKYRINKQNLELIDPIVYEGGNKKTKRTKRRRSLYKRTRHHA
jgi:hypothetical protein